MKAYAGKALMLNFAPLVIGTLVAVVLFAVIRKLRSPFGGARTFAALGAYAAPETIFGWWGAGLVLVGASSLGWMSTWTSAKALDGWFPFVFSAAAGIVCALLNTGVMRTIRDVSLSLLALAISIALIASYIGSESANGMPSFSAGIFLVPLAVSFVFGVILNVLRLFAIPKLGLSALGAIDIILFLATPFGVSLLQDIPAESQIVIIVIAAAAGFGAALAPDLVIGLAVLAISISEGAMKFILWLDSKGQVSLDWTPLVLLVGIQLGFGLCLAIARRRGAGSLVRA